MFKSKITFEDFKEEIKKVEEEVLLDGKNSNKILTDVNFKQIKLIFDKGISLCPCGHIETFNVKNLEVFDELYYQCPKCGLEDTLYDYTNNIYTYYELRYNSKTLFFEKVSYSPSFRSNKLSNIIKRKNLNAIDFTKDQIDNLLGSEMFSYNNFYNAFNYVTDYAYEDKFVKAHKGFADALNLYDEPIFSLNGIRTLDAYIPSARFLEYRRTSLLRDYLKLLKTNEDEEVTLADFSRFNEIKGDRRKAVNVFAHVFFKLGDNRQRLSNTVDLSEVTFTKIEDITRLFSTLSDYLLEDVANLYQLHTNFLKIYKQDYKNLVDEEVMGVIHKVFLDNIYVGMVKEEVGLLLDNIQSMLNQLDRNFVEFKDLGYFDKKDDMLKIEKLELSSFGQVLSKIRIDKNAIKKTDINKFEELIDVDPLEAIKFI